MASTLKTESTSATTTPIKSKTASLSNRSNPKNTENYDPNVSSPGLKLSKTPSVLKSEKRVRKYDTRNTNQLPVASPLLNKKCKQSKVLNLKKKCTKDGLSSPVSVAGSDKCMKSAEKTKCLSSVNKGLVACKIEGDNVGVNETTEEDGKKSVDKVFVERPEPRFGKVMNLVKAFENLSVLKLENSEEIEVVDTKVPGTEGLSSSFSASELFLTTESLGLDPRRSFSLDSSNGRLSLSRRTSAGGQRRRRSSTESSGTYARRKLRKKQLKGTSQKPFKLRTEQRGRNKEEEFMKKLQQMMDEEEKLRVPIAQGLPLTIDEPECLVKPPVKGTTKPVNLVLHTDMRAAERSEFDHQMAKKMSIIEQYRAEKERQQKLEEEEEIRRLRKELVPKAQPMPYFDRPFIPIRSGNNPTSRKEQKICVP